MISKILRRLNDYWFITGISSLVLIVLLLPFYTHGQMILGGEGDYWLNFTSHLKKHALLWQETGTGNFSTSINANFFLVIFFIFLQRFGVPSNLVNFILVFSIYFLPFFIFLILCRQLKLTPWLGFLISLFYVVNPFSLWLLATLNPWNLMVFAALPFLFIVIRKYYQETAKLFLFFGLATILISFTNTNPPLIAIMQLGLLASLLIIWSEHSGNVLTFVRKYLVVLSSFVLFNLWWLIGWVYFVLNVENDYLKVYALGKFVPPKTFVPMLWKSMNLQMLMPFPINQDDDYFSEFYSSSDKGFIFIIPVVLVLLLLWQRRTSKKTSIITLLFWLLFSFLACGSAGVTGKIYLFLMNNSEIFSIFKSSAEKWGYLVVFFLSLYFVYALKSLHKGLIYWLFLGPLVFYLFHGVIPLATRNMIPDFNFRKGYVVTKSYVEPDEYSRLRSVLNDDKEQYRLFSLPGGYNYQVALRLSDGRYFTGMDPVLNNTSKAFISPQNGKNNGNLYHSLSHPKFIDLLGLYNVKKIVINRNAYPWFGLVEKESLSEIETKLSEKLDYQTDGSISLYDLGNYYLPKIFIATEVVCIPENTAAGILTYLSNNEYKERRTLFQTSDNCSGSKVDENIPQIRFFKINPTVYVIDLNNVSVPYNLVFNDTFDVGWRVTISDKKLPVSSKEIATYFDGEISQMDNESNIGDIVMALVGGKSLPETRHTLANSFANSWFIMPEDLGNRSGYQLILEYKPQRLSYYGLIVTFLTFSGCLLIYFRKYRSK